MSKLREKLKERATTQLSDSVDKVLKVAVSIQDATGIDAEELLKIAAGGRCKMMSESNIRHLMSIAEEELAEQYNTQDDLPLAVDPENEDDDKDDL